MLQQNIYDVKAMTATITGRSTKGTTIAILFGDIDLGGGSTSKESAFPR